MKEWLHAKEFAAAGISHAAGIVVRSSIVRRPVTDDRMKLGLKLDQDSKDYD